VLGWSKRGAGTRWLLAAGCIGAVLILTVIWFGPTNGQFASRSISADQVPAKLDAWLTIHGLRIGLSALASIPGVIAISR
jgi:hypothetical protein